MEVIISSILYTFFFSITLQHLIALIHIYRIAANELTIQSGLFQSAEPGRTTKLCPPLSSITNFFSFLNICTTNLIALIHIYRIAANGLKQLSKIIAISWAGKHYKAIFHVFFHQDHFFNFLNMYITNLIVLTHIYTTGYKWINYPIWTIAISWAGKDYKVISLVFFQYDHFFDSLNMCSTISISSW